MSNPGAEQPGAIARRRRSREALEVARMLIADGRVRVRGKGHSRASTLARIDARLGR